MFTEPYTNFHELNLDWLIKRVKELAAEWSSYNQKWDDAEAEWEAMKEYINNYFSNLDVDARLTRIVMEMADNGQLAPILAPYVSPAVQQWLTDHAMSWDGAIDTSLTIEDMAADAKVTGDYIREILEHVASDIFPDISDYNQGTVGNVTFTWTDNNTVLNVVGNTMDEARVLRVYDDVDLLPADFRTKKLFYIDFNTVSEGLHLNFSFYDADTNRIAYMSIGEPSFIVIPEDAVGMRLDFGLREGYAFNLDQPAPKIYYAIDDQTEIFIDYNNSLKVGTSYAVPDTNDAYVAFMDKMNDIATQIGVPVTFDTPSGLTNAVYITPLQLLKIGICALPSTRIMESWGLNSYSFDVVGVNARTIPITNSYLAAVNDKCSPYGTVLGGKGGSVDYESQGLGKHRAQLTLIMIENKLYLISIMATGAGFSEIYNACGEIAYKIQCQLTGQTYISQGHIATVLGASGGYCYIEVPPMPQAFFNASTNDIKNLETFNGEQYNVLIMPASTTKVLSTIVADNYIVDEHVLCLVELSDIVGGSGHTLYNDDYIEMSDLIKASLIESNNNAATCMSKIIGKYILMKDAAIKN